MERSKNSEMKAAVGALKYEVAQVDAKVLLVVLWKETDSTERERARAGNRESRRKSTLFA